ncbi:MAG: multiheme c-type cytochrome [Sandaracinaceae bacterium]|nr:multiheme c-type cytochrome [Sandaracinaceae bacterium]
MRRGALAVLPLALLAGAALAQVAPRARLFSRHGGPVTAGSVPGLAGVEPADCEPCHAEIVTAWRRSLHARAYVDPIFRAELEGVEGRAFCVRCHAPRAEEATAEAGVDCATCHVRGGAVLGLSGRGGGAHPVVREPRLASARFCAPCHQFDFPGPEDAPRLRYFPDQRLQATFDEWRASEPARRGETCQRCHMPGASHALLGLDDEAFVAGALSVRASARAEEARPRSPSASRRIASATPSRPATSTGASSWRPRRTATSARSRSAAPSRRASSRGTASCSSRCATRACARPASSARSRSRGGEPRALARLHRARERRAPRHRPAPARGGPRHRRARRADAVSGARRPIGADRIRGDGVGRDHRRGARAPRGHGRRDGARGQARRGLAGARGGALARGRRAARRGARGGPRRPASARGGSR